MNAPSTLDLLPKLTNPMWQKMRQLYEKVALIINGNLSFGQAGITTGTGTTLTLQTVPPFTAVRQASNIDGVWVWFQAPVGANTDFTINHNLGRPISGYIIIGRVQAGDVYNSPTNAPPFSPTSYIFRASVASGQFVLFIF